MYATTRATSYTKLLYCSYIATFYDIVIFHPMYVWISYCILIAPGENQVPPVG